MKNKQRWLPPPDKIRIKSFVTGCIVTALIMCSLQSTEAEVGDNLGSLGVKIAETLGVGNENNIPGEDNFKEASLTEKLHYLQQENSNLKSDVAELKTSVGSIENSSAVSNELQVTQLLDSFKSSGKNSVAEWSSSYNLQRALATSDVAINSEQSGYMLDWLLDNGYSLKYWLDKLGFEGQIEEDFSLQDLCNDKDNLNKLVNTFYGAFAFEQCNDLRTATGNSSLKTSNTFSAATTLKNIIYFSSTTHKGGDGSGDYCYVSGTTCSRVDGTAVTIYSRSSEMTDGNTQYEISHSGTMYAKSLNFLRNYNGEKITITYIQL